MPETNKTIAAIDIGTNKTIAIAATKDEQGKIIIRGIGEADTQGVIRGSVQNIGLASASIKEAVEKCQRVAHVNFKNVFVGISGQSISGEINSHSKIIDNFITDDDIAQLTRELLQMSSGQGENIVQIIPQNYTVDNVSVGINPKGCIGRKLEGTFFIVKGKDKAVKNLKTAVEMAGLTVIKLILEPMASAEAVLSKDEKEIGVLVADIGAGTADIAVYQDNILRYVAVVPLGGKAITNDIKKGCAVIERQAEQIKTQFGAALSQKDFAKKVISIKGVNGKTKEIPFNKIATIINARTEEILGGIAYELDAIKSQNISLAGGIVFTGGTAKLKNILQLAKFCLGIEARKGIPLNVPPEYAYENYSAAVGLIYRGMEYYEELMERKRKEAEKQKQAATEQNTDKNKEPKGKEPKGKDNSQGGISGFFRRLTDKIFSDPDDSKM